MEGQGGTGGGREYLGNCALESGRPASRTRATLIERYRIDGARGRRGGRGCRLPRPLETPSLRLIFIFTTSRSIPRSLPIRGGKWRYFGYPRSRSSRIRIAAHPGSNFYGQRAERRRREPPTKSTLICLRRRWSDNQLDSKLPDGTPPVRTRRIKLKTASPSRDSSGTVSRHIPMAHGRPVHTTAAESHPLPSADVRLPRCRARHRTPARRPKNSCTCARRFTRVFFATRIQRVA